MARVVVVLAFAVVAVVACGRSDAPPRKDVNSTSAGGSARRPVRVPSGEADSTIAARDYIGPDACGECHPDQHAQWKTSLHRVMNARAEQGAVVGNFDGATLPYQGGTATMTRDERGFVMAFARGESTVRYRVTRTIGRRGLQEYVGVEEGGSGEEVRLPIGWWPRRAGWYPQPFFDPWLDEDDLDIHAPVREPWAERCPWCHSTYPFEQRIARASGPARLGHGLEQHFTLPAGGTRLAVAAQVTTGISCESCHLGGRAHADGAPMHFVPIGATAKPGAPKPTTFAAERADPAIVNRVCAQCHSGPSPRFPDGTATRNSSEALDLARSPCTTARCTDCHDPHTGGSDERRAIAACTRCHDALADAASARAHAGAGHDAVTCLDCHMPRVVMGIDHYVRTHRISSPTGPAMLEAAAPNACNLCHLDRSIAWLTAELRRQYDVRLDARDWARYGDDRAVGEVWLASDEPDIRLIAAMAYARSPLGRYALADILPLLADPRPFMRTWGQFAIEDILGCELTLAEYDARAPADVRARQLAALRVTLGARP